MKKLLISLFALLFFLPMTAAAEMSVLGGVVNAFDSDGFNGDIHYTVEGRITEGKVYAAANYLSETDDAWQAGGHVGAMTEVMGFTVSGGVGVQYVKHSGGVDVAPSIQAGVEMPLGGFGVGVHAMRTFSEAGYSNTLMLTGRLGF